MCTGAEFLGFFQMAGAALGAVSSLKSMTGSKSPEIVQAAPVADAAAATDKAAQEAQQKKLAMRRAARANSLLSEAGGMGDGSDPLTQSATAGGKLSLGS